MAEFSVRGCSRFLSHAETMRVFQRACIRGGVNLAYSKGFNPHPKLSLPFPRSVGMESEGDLLCLRLEAVEGSIEPQQIRTTLANQLPEGFELQSVRMESTHVSYLPCSATYVFVIKRDCEDELKNKLRQKAETLLKNQMLVVERRKNAAGNIRKVDVRKYLASIDVHNDRVSVTVAISPSGTIRVDEIMRLLGLIIEDLEEPPKRLNIMWQQV